MASASAAAPKPNPKTLAGGIPPTMRAVRLDPPSVPIKDPTKLGPAKEVPAPDPAQLKPGEIIVKNEVAGINFLDVYHRNGTYPNPTGLLGAEGGGVVAATRDDADAAFLGRRVAYCMWNGSYAEYTVVPSSRCVSVPDDVSMELAMAVMTQGLTAHYLTADCTGQHRLGPDSWVLIHAAGSGTGNLVAQVASRVFGANVVGTASTGKLRDAKERGGCKIVVDYTDKTDLGERLRALTPGGQGFHVVYDGVGKDTWEHSLAATRARGMIAMFGGASGPVPPLDVLQLTRKGSLFLTRPSLANYIADPAEYRARFADVVSWHKRGLITLEMDPTPLTLDDVAKAHAFVEGGGARGKMVVRV